MPFDLQNQKEIERRMTEIYLVAIILLALLAELNVVLLVGARKGRQTHECREQSADYGRVGKTRLEQGITLPDSPHEKHAVLQDE